MPPAAQQDLVDDIAAALSSVAGEILARQLGHLDQADPAYGAGVRAALRPPDR